MATDSGRCRSILSIFKKHFQLAAECLLIVLRRMHRQHSDPVCRMRTEVEVEVKERESAFSVARITTFWQLGTGSVAIFVHQIAFRSALQAAAVVLQPHP